jgi:hypothetical protein
MPSEFNAKMFLGLFDNKFILHFLSAHPQRGHCDGGRDIDSFRSPRQDRGRKSVSRTFVCAQVTLAFLLVCFSETNSS